MTKLSFTTMGTPEKSGVEAIRMARQFGYQGIDLRISDFKGELRADSTPNEIQVLKGALSESEIELAGLLCYNDFGNHEDAGSWKKMEASILKHLDIAQAMGSPRIRIFGGPIHLHPSADEFIKRHAEGLNNVFERHDSGIEIVLQNHGGSYTFLQGTELADATGSDRFGLVFSPDHCQIMHEDWAEVIARAKAYSRQMYVSDVTFFQEDGAEHNKGILPGTGAIKLAEAYAAIGGRDFEGWVSFKWEKIWQAHLEEPELALPYFVDFFNDEMSRAAR